MSRKILLGTSLGAALLFMILGAILWGGFNASMEMTNSLEFCTSCHEMEEYVFKEYQQTSHYTNRSGIRATCADCHVPRPWIHKMVRKIHATNEVFHKVLGTIDTREKYDAKRLEMAKNVWRNMKQTDSRECRNCHDFDSMQPEDQKKVSRIKHAVAMRDGNTCIDCHKGIAHKKVHDQLTDEELKELSRPTLENKREIAPQWQSFIDGGMQLDSTESKAQGHASELTTPPASRPSAIGVDWSDIESRSITLFYPGQTSLEWLLDENNHEGSADFVDGIRCFSCHEEAEATIGDLISSGQKHEPTPIPGKRGSIQVNIRAAHDDENLYLQFQWEDGGHTDAPFVEGGKMDPANPIKLAVMISADDEGDPRVEFAGRAGCWQTCHQDLNAMPQQPESTALTSKLSDRLDLSAGFTKYLKESRTDLSIDHNEGLKRSGWHKLKGDTEIQSLLHNGSFMDLLRYKSGNGESEDGHILEQRVMSGGQGVDFSGELRDGIWTVEMSRKLTSDKAGDISMALDRWYNIGFAIHDDYSSGRFHHVSLGLKLGFDDDETDINAVAR